MVVFDQGFCSVSNFLAAILVARACTQAGYSQYVLALTLLITFQIVLRSLGSVPFTVHSPRLSGRECAEYFGSTLVQHAILSSLIALAMAAVAGLFHVATGRTETATVLAALSLAFLGVALRDFMRLALLAQLRVWASLILGMVANLSMLTLLVGAYVTGRLSTATALLIFAASSGLAGAGALVYQWKQIAFVGRRIAGDVKRNWACGKWTLATVLSNTAGIRAMPWLVLLWCGNEAVALFGVLMAVAGIINPLVMGLSGYLMPTLSGSYASRGGGAAVAAGLRAVKILAVASVAYVAAVILLGDRVTGLLFTSRYQGHGGALVVLSLAVAADATTVPLRALLRVVNRPRTEFHATALGLVVGLAMSVYLVPSFGVLGAALAVVSVRATGLLAGLVGLAKSRSPVLATEMVT